MEKSDLILDYKSHLFDLIKTNNKCEIKELINAIAELFDVKCAIYYAKDIENSEFYRIDYMYNPYYFNINETVSSYTINQLFKKDDYIHQPPTGKQFLSFFNFAFFISEYEMEDGCLFLSIPHHKFKEFSTTDFQHLVIESRNYIYLKKEFKLINQDRKKYIELYQVTDKFHSSMNTDNILFEVIHTLQRVFPEFEYTLMLSTDYSYNPKLPIQSFEYDSIDELAMEAYVSGSIQIATTIKNTRTLLYAPLRGRQGVYGVLQVAALAKHMFEKSDVEFIHLLATTAGNALENAKLYQKSMSSIEDLRLINTISQQLNSRTNLKETIQFLFSQIADAFNVSEIGFVLAQDNQYEILPGSSSIFEENEGRACIDRIYQQFLKKHEPLFISDLHKRYPQYRFRFASIMAIPMVQENSLEGFCVALHEDAYHFTFEMFKLFQSIIHHSTMALVNAMLREKLEKMVITDHLTQLFSKNYLNSRIEQSMKTDRQGTFILLDIDDFKKVNDTYGHQVGDEVLIQVAKLIRKNIRSTDVGARWGGEEMAIYLPEVSLKIGEKIAKRILKAVENHTKPPITISCGISYWSNVSEKVEKLFNRADAGLYHAKHLGKNRIVINH